MKVSRCSDSNCYRRFIVPEGWEHKRCPECQEAHENKASTAPGAGTAAFIGVAALLMTALIVIAFTGGNAVVYGAVAMAMVAATVLAAFVIPKAKR